MITCPKCGKDNQDHYKFCLGCGAELPRDVSPKPFAPQTPPQGMRAAQAVQPQGGLSAFGGTVALPPQPQPQGVAPRPAPPPATGPAPAPAPSASPTAAPAPAAQAPVAGPSNQPSAPSQVPSASFQAAPAAAPPGPAGASPPATGATVQCPQCGHVNSSAHLFCGSCGFRLQQAPSRVAPAPAPPQPAAEPAGPALVLTALRADGSEAGTYSVPGGSGTVGRETGGVFAGDSYLSPRHATFRAAGPGRAIVKDEGSLNGVYKKLGRDLPVELKQNDIFRIGQEIIRYQPFGPLQPAADGVERLGAPSKGYVGRIALVIGREETGNAFPIPEIGVHLGRERGDILFPEDGYVSGLHCRLTWDGQRLFLTDLGSSNGTFLRLTAEAEVRGGDVLLMGQQLFRIAL